MKILFNAFFSVILFCSFSFAQIDSSGYLNAGNDKIFYETAGEGPALIFLHDGLVHHEIWDYQVQYFSQKYKVIRYDRRGYGNSSAATGAFSNVEDLRSLYVQLKIDKACLIAMSAGGALAIDFALQFPEKVSSLILVGEFDIPDVHAHAGAINAGIVNSKRDIIPKSGHLIPIEQPELFNDAVEKFLDASSQE